LSEVDARSDRDGAAHGAPKVNIFTGMSRERNQGSNGSVAFEQNNATGFALRNVVDETEALGLERGDADRGFGFFGCWHSFPYMVHIKWSMWSGQDYGSFCL
jgi:hypothetical protein